jgi:RNA polymerase sigma-70 factor (ECF subfamily)
MQLERELITAERKKMVESVLEELSPRERAALRGIFLEERKKEEVCREMGINPDHLRVLVHRAKASFRKKIGLFNEKAPNP